MGMDVTPVLWIIGAIVAIVGLMHGRDVLRKLPGSPDPLFLFVLVFVLVAVSYWVVMK